MNEISALIIGGGGGRGWEGGEKQIEKQQQQQKAPESLFPHWPVKRCWPSPHCDHTGALIVDFPASTAVKNKFVLFISHPAHGVWLQKPE